jgi:hypothetical protein
MRACELLAEQLRADMNASERDALVKAFQEDEDSTQILICSYSVSCAGLNLQALCCTVIEFELAPCEGVRQQMLGRIRRRGQTRWCRHICLTAKDSFNTRQTAMSLLKGLPALMTQLNLEVFGGSDADVDQEHLLGEYVRFKDDIYPVDDRVVAGMGLAPLDPDTLLVYIQQKMAGSKLEGDYTTLHDAAHGKGQVPKGSARYEWLEMTRRKDLSKVGTQQADWRGGRGLGLGRRILLFFLRFSFLGFYEEYHIGRCTDASSDMVLFVQLFITVECI